MPPNHGPFGIPPPSVPTLANLGRLLEMSQFGVSNDGPLDMRSVGIPLHADAGRPVYGGNVGLGLGLNLIGQYQGRPDGVAPPHWNVGLQFNKRF
jgi:hypothetical protein